MYMYDRLGSGVIALVAADSTRSTRTSHLSAAARQQATRGREQQRVDVPSATDNGLHVPV